MPVTTVDSEEIKQLKTELGSLIGTIDESDFTPFSPPEELVARIGELVHQRFDGLVAQVEPNREYNVRDMAEAFEIALEKLGGAELGWRVTIVPNSSALAVSAHQKQIEVGENRPTIKGSILAGRILHELGVHTGRSINAEKAGWLSAQYGQDGYLDFEESFATALEDAYHGRFVGHGENYQIIAGLAYGLDNHSSRDFRQVYEVMWRTNALSKIKDGQISQDSLAKVKSSTFTSCMRLFRGTTSQQKGVVYLKDLAYFNGQESVWTILQAIQTQQDFDVLFTGKLDNSRKDHQAIAQHIMTSLA